MSKRSWARLPKECIIPSCDNKPAAKGMCSTHYCRQRDGIDMDAPIVKRTQNVGECAADDCQNGARVKGWCDKHYRRFKATGDPLKTRWKHRSGGGCSVAGCAKASSKGGFCEMHHKRSLIHGDPNVSAGGGRSVAEDAIFGFVRSIAPNAVQSDRSTVSPYELDIYITRGANDIAIEFNGIYWHDENHVGKDHHHMKYSLCKERGIQLIQIWEDEWNRNPELVKHMIARKLGVRERAIGARRTQLTDLSYRDAKDFLDANHIQGGAAGSSYVGLADKKTGELVAVGVFKRRKDGSAELVRYAATATVHGGLKKMMSHLSYDRFITFADHCVSSGALYEETGWINDGELPPDYRYVVDGQRVHKFNYRLKRFREDAELEYVEGLTERELADLNGIPRIWDAGKTRYVYTKS